VLYSSTVLIPQMLQQLLAIPQRWPAWRSPPAAPQSCLHADRWFSRFSRGHALPDHFGCTISASALLVMAGWNLSLDFKHAVLGRVLQSFGLAFLFIPINVSAFANVRAKNEHGHRHHQSGAQHWGQRGHRHGTTLLERRTQLHQMRLMDHVNNMNPR